MQAVSNLLVLRPQPMPSRPMDVDEVKPETAETLLEWYANNADRLSEWAGTVESLKMNAELDTRAISEATKTTNPISGSSIFGFDQCGEFDEQVQKTNTLYAQAVANLVKTGFLAKAALEAQIVVLAERAEKEEGQTKSATITLAGHVASAIVGIERFIWREGTDMMLLSSSRTTKSGNALLVYQKTVDGVMRPRSVSPKLRYTHLPETHYEMEEPPRVEADGGAPKKASAGKKKSGNQ